MQKNYFFNKKIMIFVMTLINFSNKRIRNITYIEKISILKAKIHGYLIVSMKHIHTF